MNEQELYLALKTVLNKIRDKKVYWRLEGSVNLFVNGVPVTPKDIDITTNQEGLQTFRRILKKEVVKDFYIKENKARVCKCQIEKTKVEIAVYDEEDKDSFQTIQMKSWKGLVLPTQPLQVALNFYKKINRLEKVQLIQQFISSNSLKQEK